MLGFGRDVLERLLVRVAKHRHDQAIRQPDRDADVDVALALDPAIRPGGIDLWKLRQRQRDRLDDQVVDADRLRLVDRLIEHLAQPNGIVHGDFGRDIEVRRRELALGEPHRDGGLHLRELDHLDFFLRAWRRLTLLACRTRRRRGGCGRGGLALSALLSGRFDVVFRNSSTWAAALDLAQVDPVLFRQAPGNR